MSRVETESASAAGRFWDAAEELPDAPEVPANLPPALERLGPSPFPKSGFPFLGFLATVYDHVASHVGGAESNSY
jgi:hypothetical protein